MKEFFSNETSNERKREIEQVLHAFSSQQGSWHHSLYFLAHSADPYVCMYCLTTIEVSQEMKLIKMVAWLVLFSHGVPFFCKS